MLKIAAFVFGCIMLALAMAFAFQDEVGLALINPNRSYEAYTPPPRPDYAAADAWLARGDGTGRADIFFIHQNVYRGDGNWNAPYDRQSQLGFLKDVLLPLHAGPFMEDGRLWAPRYREPTFYARFTQKQPGIAARNTAYGDIADAFAQFLKEREDGGASGRPFILAGYGDGALLAGKLLAELIAPDETLRRHMAAAYGVGMPLPRAEFADMICQEPDEARCLLAFVPVDRRFQAYQERLRSRTLTLRGKSYASSSNGEEICQPPPLPPTVNAVKGGNGATIATRLVTECADGVLLVDTPEDRRLRKPRFFGVQWYPDDVNLFAEPLRIDAARRLETVLETLAAEARIAPPMAPAEEVGTAPVNRVPASALGLENP